jgi:23S rRNA-/tRNA-specific pseudouridylate synthase
VPSENLSTAKDAQTRFQFISYCDKVKHSIVKCYPKTGRTHQIRVHLKSLGYPIANDQMYGGDVDNYTEDDPEAVRLDAKDFLSSY